MFWRRRARLDEEMAEHLAAETADNLARGMSPEDARLAALRTFGNVGVAKERARELDPLYWLDTLWQDVRFAFRVMGRNRWSSFTIVTTLTLAITVNVVVFTWLNAVVLRSWVKSHPETFVSVFPKFSGKYGLRFSDGRNLSKPDYEWFRDAAKSLTSLAAYRFQGATLGGEESGSVQAGLASCNLFAVLDPGQPVLGRYFLPEDCERAGGAPVAVVSEPMWRRVFNADPGIVGRTVSLNRIPFRVVGVAPEVPLTGSANGAHMWVPYTMLGVLRAKDDYLLDARAQWLTIAGRRRADVSIAQVQQELNLLARAADERVPGRQTSLIVTDGSLMQHPELGAKVPIVFLLTLGTTTLLLVLACVNVTTLLLSRAAARHREVAVRLSMGAGRFRLIRQLLTETVVLSSLAAGLSLLIAPWLINGLWFGMVNDPPQLDLTPDWRVLVYCVAVSLVAGALAGLSPALETMRPQLVATLKGSGGAVSQGRSGTRLRGVLVAVQIALSLVLLVQAGLYTRVQRQLLSHDPGFETKQVVSLMLTSVATGFEPPVPFYRELEQRIAAIPGVTQLTEASIGPWGGRNSTEIAEIDGKPVPATRDYNRDPARRLVTPSYFAALDIPLTRGRVFLGSEATGAVISEAMARRYWPAVDPVGRSFRVGDSRLQVVGVCRDVQSLRLMFEDGPFYYLPLDSQARPPVLLIRVAGDPAAVVKAVRETVRRLDPQMSANVITLGTILENQAKSLQPVSILGSIAGGLALLLALTGVYGVVSYSVSQRVREIGLRMALGAQRNDVVWLVLRSGTWPVFGGLVAGTALAVGLTQVLASVLFGLGASQASGTLLLVPLLLALTAAGAIWIPARRAAALDPLDSLRHD